MPNPYITNQANVGTVIDITPGDDLTAFIATADIIITDECTASGYDNTRLELLERWVAAHLYACNRRRSASEGISGGANQSLDGFKADLGLEATMYGQQAMMLDTAGNLAAMTNSMKTVKKLLPIQGASIVWLGERHHHHHH